jgi:hypothetical protein
MTPIPNNSVTAEEKISLSEKVNDNGTNTEVLNVLATRTSFDESLSSRTSSRSRQGFGRRGSVLNRPEMMTIFDQIDLSAITEEDVDEEESGSTSDTRISVVELFRPTVSPLLRTSIVSRNSEALTLPKDDRTSESLPQLLAQDERIAEKGAWRKKVEQEEVLRKMVLKADRTYVVKKRLKKLKDKLHFRSKHKNDSKVYQLAVVFPIPSKDPLITHRKISDIATAMQVNSSELLR